MILALDTSTLTLSLALVSREGAVKAEFSEGPPRKQSEMLPQAVRDFLSAQGVTLESLGGFLVGAGPGSFTGLRIGLSTVKGLAYALKKSVAQASSLAAVAMDAPEGVPVFAVAEARKGELYVGQFVRQGLALEAFGPEVAWPVAELGARLKATAGSVAIGPAVRSYRAALREVGAVDGALLDTVPFPRAANLAALVSLPVQLDLPALFALEPRYVMGSGAEANPRFPALPGPEPTARRKADEP